MARWIVRAVLGGLLIGCLLVMGTAFRVWYVGRSDHRAQTDVIVVLGAAQYNGEPSGVLRARLQHAKRLYEHEVADTILTTGGSRPGDISTEAAAGAAWLRQHGVPERNVVAVSDGRNTLGSLRAAASVADDRGWQDSVIVSDPWHSLRARTMLRDLGMDASVSPTHTGPIVRSRSTELRYIVRETGALLYYRLTPSPTDTVDGFELLS